MTAPWESEDTILSFHGTVMSALPLILEQGLGAPIPARKVSLSPFEEVAVYYASQRAVAPDGGAVLAYEVPAWVYDRGGRHGDLWSWEVRVYPVRLPVPAASYTFDLTDWKTHLLAARARDEARGRVLLDRDGGDGAPSLDPVLGTLKPAGQAQMAAAVICS